MENITNLDIVKQEILKSKNAVKKGSLIFVYNNSRTINVYNSHGKSVGTYTVASTIKNKETLKESVDEYL